MKSHVVLTVEDYEQLKSKNKKEDDIINEICASISELRGRNRELEMQLKKMLDALDALNDKVESKNK